MNYTTCGNKKISAMTFGTVQLGMNYGISNNLGKPSEEKSFALLCMCPKWICAVVFCILHYMQIL